VQDRFACALEGDHGVASIEAGRQVSKENAEVLGEALRSGDLPPQLREEAESFVAQGP